MTTPSNSSENISGPGAHRESTFVQDSITQFLQLVLTKWWLFAIIGMIAGVAGYLKASWQKAAYESNLTFVVDQDGNNGGMSGAMSLAAQFGFNIGGANDMFSGDNILEIIKSRRLLETVLLSVDTFDNKPYPLIEYFLQNTAVKKPDNKKKPVHFIAGQPKSTFSYAQDSVLYNTYLDFAKNYVEADRPDKKLDIFSIRVRSFNEKFSKIFTDKLIHAADSFYIEICSKKTKETLEILEKRVGLMKGNLVGSITSKAASEDANLNPVFSEAQVPVQKQQANIQVYGAAYSEMFKNLELARFQYLKKIPLVQIIDAADYPLKKVKASKLKTALYFALGAVFIVFFFMWLIRIYKINK